MEAILFDSASRRKRFRFVVRSWGWKNGGTGNSTCGRDLKLKRSFTRTQLAGPNFQSLAMVDRGGEADPADPDSSFCIVWGLAIAVPLTQIQI